MTPQERDAIESGTLVEFQRREIERLRAIIRCEQESGQCVMIHDPDRDPCTRRNCHYMGVSYPKRVNEQKPESREPLPTFREMRGIFKEGS